MEIIVIILGIISAINLFALYLVIKALTVLTKLKVSKKELLGMIDELLNNPNF